ncbi:hypothetical protein O1R50_20020 [Glycomyces luteolus]|uniref:PT repeat-containing protein n=1 Tax=Glycomyces luteolus TaxID=2670330 RepID=A0A9X3PN64_9ACTN|nr:hypothetical protein [Glycomyces luteolus]MDA1361925.1 hypothetical protein [Glycomyces luteolus]
MRTIPSLPRHLMHTAVLTAAGLLLTACGSADETEENPDQSASSGGDVMSAYVSCIEEQGIELPEDWAADLGGGMPSFDPENAPTDMPTNMPTDLSGEMPTDMPTGGFGGGFEAPEGVSDEEWQAAQEACADEMPTDGGFPGGEAPSSGESVGLTAYRDCLAERGVELADDVSQLDETDPEVAAAMEECTALAPESSAGS